MGDMAARSPLATPRGAEPGDLWTVMQHVDNCRGLWSANSARRPAFRGGKVPTRGGKVATRAGTWTSDVAPCDPDGPSGTRGWVRGRGAVSRGRGWRRGGGGRGGRGRGGSRPRGGTRRRRPAPSSRAECPSAGARPRRRAPTPPGRTAARGSVPRRTRTAIQAVARPYAGCSQPVSAAPTRTRTGIRGTRSAGRGCGAEFAQRASERLTGQRPLADLGPHRPFATSTRCAGPTVEPLHRLAERRSTGPRRGTTRPSACTDPTAAADPTATARPATPRSSTGSVSTGSAHRARAWPSGKTSSSVQW